MSDLARLLGTTLGESYQVDRELGGGGMSRVFLVTDTKLGRPITVKILEPELAEGVNADRFAREVRIVAQLQHPNIVPVLSAGDLEGLPYYTMPFVSGRSARELLGEGKQLPIRRVVQILRDVARALEAAHLSGVVHRDIKPDNILLTDNAAAVCDFGIAKAVSSARKPSGAPTLTGIGIAVGTPAYMAPEQVVGDDQVDPRADFYAFGATAYELLTGEPPFAGPSAAALLKSQVSAVPIHVSRRRPDTPAPLASLVMRCLEKDPVQRPQSASDLLDALDGIPREEVPRRTRLYAGVLAALGLAATIGYLATRSPAKDSEGRSVAVLPFANLSGDSAAEYFSDGMTEQLVSDLGRANGLRVAPRAMTFALKGRTEDPRSVADRLQVDVLVGGSVRRSGNQLRVEAELMDPRSNQRLWGASFDRTPDDVFLVQEEIARSITSALRASLAPPRAAAQRTDAETYDLFLRGKHHLRSRGGPRRRALDSAVAAFNAAIARDSSFAAAWAGLSDGYREMAEHVTPLTVLPRAKDAARRAVQLDPNDLDAGIALANITLNFDWNWEAAEREYRRVLALHPHEPAAYSPLSGLLLAARRYDEALDISARGFETELRRATDTAQARIRYTRRVAQINGVAGRREAAEAALAELVRLDPFSQSTHHTRGWVLMRWNPTEAAREMELARAMFRNQLPQLAHLGVIYGHAGHRDTTRRIIQELLERSRSEYVPKDQLFTLYLALGDQREALLWLRRAVDERHWWLPYLNGHPMAEPVRHDSAYQSLLGRIGVPASAR